MPENAIINLVEVARTYPGTSRPAVQHINLSLHPGELLALLGPSGCGKTTTLRLIGGFERPDNGQISIEGQLVAGDGRWRPPEKRHLGMVFQDYALFPHLSVVENIRFGLRRLERKASTARVAELVHLTGLAGLERRYPHQLSGGQQQRVAIARALAPRPGALLLDEAFNSLDATSQSVMHREVLAILKAEQVAAVLVTHDQEEAFVLADRMAVMNEGVIEQIGPPQEIYRQPGSRFVAGFVGKANFVPARWEQGGLMCEMGRLPVPQNLAPGQPAGESLDFLLRPHEIELQAGEAGAGAPGVVLSRTYGGAASRYLVRLHSTGQPLEVSCDADYQPGDEVKLQARPRYINAYRQG